jgi:CDP-diacylglycerol--glycerol-3-phosphate 3-phosphatidyltransferase
MNTISDVKTLSYKLYATKERIFRIFARWLPAWLSPNILSGLRAILIIPIFFLYRHEQLTWVVVIFLIAMLTDVLDGVAARTQNKITAIGKLLDPAADKVVFVGLFLLAAPDKIAHGLILTLIALEGILVLLATVAGPLAAKIFQLELKLGANWAGKIKMTLEGLALTLLLIGYDSQAAINVSQLIFYLAVIAAALSILLHLTFLRKKTIPEKNPSA